MACVILPSETARLVYGYLVKENLNEIALQFLESSPYLTDCYQIVKSGYQFNTKLMSKDLQELLQEYSIIHNLVNNKVSLLCKTSLLYKKIKLKCESLSQILELILFWKSKNTKREENTLDEKTENSENTQVLKSNCEHLNIVDIALTKNHIKTFESNYNSNSVTNWEQKDDFSISNHFNSKLCCKTYSPHKAEVVENDAVSQKIKTTSFESNSVNKKISLFMQSEESQSLESNEIIGSNTTTTTTTTTNYNCNNNNNNNNRNSSKRNNNNNNNDDSTINVSNNSCNYNDNNNDGNNDNKNVNIENDNDMNNCSSNNNICINDNIGSFEPKINDNTNIVTIDLNYSKEDVISNAPSTLDSNEEVNRFESQIKIVGIETKTQNENHAMNDYTKSLDNGEGNINLENSSIVFVSPEVGNVTIGQERNQIIVIPIDYYKAQDEMHNRMDISNKNHDLIQKEKIITQEKNELIFDEVAAAVSSSTSDQAYISKSLNVDENIITEKDFFKNGQLVYNLENDLKKVDVQHLPVPSVQKSNENIPLHSVPPPVIVVSQTFPQSDSKTIKKKLLPNKSQRYRPILPKDKESLKMQPIVVIQPLIEKNKYLTKTDAVVVDSKIKTEVSEKRKKNIPLPKKSKKEEIENSENLNMPIIKTPVPEKIIKETNLAKPEILELKNEEQTKAETENTNEEKENFEKTESKKTETPVFVTRKNSKRQSLSTPRRRSHIRALEFETPPKTNEEKKKSKTSPKIRIDQVSKERKSVRNTLFKSPIPEISSKSPVASKGNKKVNSEANSKPMEVVELLNELSIPIATRSPNKKLSEAWENLTGVGCVIGQTDDLKASLTKKMWDADLRCFIPENNQETEKLEKKRIRKPERNQKDIRKTTKKKIISTKKSKLAPMTISPSKISLTAKRNTYSINGNEGSPIRTLFDDLKIVTPFKDIETVRATEETPLTKLLRENINSIDIDLSMINTPSFPPTPSIIITPDFDEVSMSGTNYYSPTKDKILKITDYFKVDSEKTNKKESKEMHEKVIGDLVSKAKEIIGIGKENQEESVTKGRPSGKILSMVKIQMLTQCNKKLCENIPINEETAFSSPFANQTTLIGNLSEEAEIKHDLKGELEEKRIRALEKIKVVKENLNHSKNRVVKRGKKRKRNGNLVKADNYNSHIFNEAVEEKHHNESEETPKKELEIFHSTPYAEKKIGKFIETDSSKKLSSKVLEEIRQEFPPFQDNSTTYPELTEKSRKKLHFVENFIKLSEIVKYIDEFNEKNPPKLFLKSSLRRFFQVFYKWLKHPHKRELNASQETKAVLQEYLLIFDKINQGLKQRNKTLKKNLRAPDAVVRLSGSDVTCNKSGHKPNLSDEEEGEWKKKENDKRKDEENEDGVVSTLPLKKRKSTVQQVEIKTASILDKDNSKKNCTENVSQTQNFLQDIDVDRFLFQIHGQENR